MDLRQACVRLLMCAALIWPLFTPPLANAWKPYTHNYTGEQVLGGVNFETNSVVIGSANYPVSPLVIAAIKQYPQHYYAGTVGPDGFPDLTFGQAVIHPEQTGDWILFMLDRAWKAQASGSYTDEEKAQILAFSYGYFTHAAGDVWGHTLTNEFSGSTGVFPAFGDVLTKPPMTAIALKHIISEGYIGDATPGYDGNNSGDHFVAAPSNYCKPPMICAVENNYMSDDTTPGYPMAAPTRFIYDVLIKPDSQTPIPAVRGKYMDARGPLIGFFLEAHDALAETADQSYKDPLDGYIDYYYDTLANLNAIGEACDFDSVKDVLNCPAEIAEFGFDVVIDSVDAFWDFVTATAEDIGIMVVNAYLNAWVEDIDQGLAHWGEFGLATTKGLFDAQFRRDLQYKECFVDKMLDPISTPELYKACAQGVGIVKVLLDSGEGAATPFINEYLLSMAGFPDFVGDLRSILEDFSEIIDPLVTTLGLPFAPIKEGIAQVEAYVKDKIQAEIEKTIGIDVEQLTDFLKKPTSYLCMTDIQLTLPELGTLTIPLFNNNELGRLDNYLGFTRTDHLDALPGFPENCGRLSDLATYNPQTFAPIKNTVTLGRLLLLDGPPLNQLLSDLTGGRTISTYKTGENIMTKALGYDGPADPPRHGLWVPLSTYAQNDAVIFNHTSYASLTDSNTNNQPDLYPDAWTKLEWLRLIDGDHAWRVNGQPKFDLEGNTPREPVITGGTGTFPIWKSCVLRPAFRSLFADWENAGNPAGSNFPELGDLVAADPVNDPNPPTSAIAVGGTHYSSGGKTYVAGNNVFTITAHDTPAGKAFADSDLSIQYRTYTDPAVRGDLLAIAQNGTVNLVGTDGTRYIDTSSADPCHAFNGEPAAAESAQQSEFVLDATAPVVTCTQPPFNMTHSTAELEHLAYSSSDSGGSGVAASSATIDGLMTNPATPVAIVNGGLIDTYLYNPGIRTVHVTAADNLGNSGTTSCTFRVLATPQSLIDNVRRAWNEHLITDPSVYYGLLDKLNAAKKAQGKNNKETELNNLMAFISQLEAQRGKGINLNKANQFIAYAQDLIANGG